MARKKNAPGKEKVNRKPVPVVNKPGTSDVLIQRAADAIKKLREG
jgi:hypothetical protein